MQLAFGLLIMSSSLRLFGADFNIRRREEDGEGLIRQYVVGCVRVVLGWHCLVWMFFGSLFFIRCTTLDISRIALWITASHQTLLHILPSFTSTILDMNTAVLHWYVHFGGKSWQEYWHVVDISCIIPYSQLLFFLTLHTGGIYIIPYYLGKLSGQSLEVTSRMLQQYGQILKCSILSK